MKLLLDTNFLMLPAQHKVDIYSKLKGHEFLTTVQCIKELKKIAKGKGKPAVHAKVALELAENNVKVVSAEGNPDSAILDYAVRNNCAVATNDRILIQSLKRHNIKIIRLRQWKLLTEE